MLYPSLPAFVIAVMTGCSPAAPPLAEPDPPPAGSGPGLVAKHFAADSAAQRSEVAAKIDRSLGERPEQLSDWLHGAGLFRAAQPGRQDIAVDVGHGRKRRVVVRTPRGYDPSRPWPLIIAYHAWGGSAESILRMAEKQLGADREKFVIAAPHDYRQTVLDHPEPISSEHPVVWRAVKEFRHIDSDRVYLYGYSLGGDTSMTFSTLHGDQFAATVAMACSYSFPSDVPGMWAKFLPNLAHLPILHVWGDRDKLNVPGLNFRRSPATTAGLNERLARQIGELGLDKLNHVRLAGRGHGGNTPSAKQLRRYLDMEREGVPHRFTHAFRYLHQAQAHWVEGHAWMGQGWFTRWPQVQRQRGENKEQAEARTIFELLGDIAGRIEGNTVHVDTQHLADLTVWFTDGMVEFGEFVRIVHNGKTVYEGMIERDVNVALVQAERTGDFDRLRWAGVRISGKSGKARLVTAEDKFPPLLFEM